MDRWTIVGIIVVGLIVAGIIAAVVGFLYLIWFLLFTVLDYFVSDMYVAAAMGLLILLSVCCYISCRKKKVVIKSG